MFTGLIEDLGKIINIKNNESGMYFSVELHISVDDIKIGDSISINGVCETVTGKNNQILDFVSMNETIKRTNFKYLKIGNLVNVERAMRINSRLDGHLVSGHVDSVAKLISIYNDGLAKIFKFECDTDLIIEKGSITINGISLTVVNFDSSSFCVSILPHTLDNTNLKNLKQNDFVNIEYDMVAKYIKKFTCTPKKEITEKFLLENGF